MVWKIWGRCCRKLLKRVPLYFPIYWDNYSKVRARWHTFRNSSMTKILFLKGKNKKEHKYKKAWIKLHSYTKSLGMNTNSWANKSIANSSSIKAKRSTLKKPLWKLLRITKWRRKYCLKCMKTIKNWARP